MSRVMNWFMGKVMDREKIIETGLTCSAFVFKSDKALEILVKRMAAAGMAEEDIETALAASRARHQRVLLITALVLLAAGFAVRELFGESTTGRVGTMMVFLGLVATAIRVKRSDKPSPMSMQAISEVFRKK